MIENSKTGILTDIVNVNGERRLQIQRCGDGALISARIGDDIVAQWQPSLEELRVWLASVDE